MKEAESTTVDVLIARISTHPEEFFVAEAVITQDGARIFAGTKWRRITTMLMAPTNGEMNLWIEMFSDEEKARFRTAMLEALRGVIDTQMMKVLTGGDPVELDPEEKQRRQEIAMKQALMQQYAQNQQQMNALGAMASQGLTGHLTLGYGGPSLPSHSSYEKYLEDEERKAFEKIAKSHPKTLAQKVKGWL